MLGQDSAGSQNSTDPGGTHIKSKGSSNVGSSSARRSKISRFESSGEKQPKPCKYILNKQDCPFGDKCRYRHSLHLSLTTDETTAVAHVVTNDSALPTDAQRHLPLSSPSTQQQKRRHVPVCHYYLNSTCKYGSNCRYRHPKPRPYPPSNSSRNVESKDGRCGNASGRKSSDKLSLGAFLKVADKPVEQSHRSKVKKTDSDLREVELAQMLVQFSEEQCVLVEKGSHGVVYRITFYPTDTEWMYNAVDLLVTFPAQYPTEPLSVQIPNDQELPHDCCTYLEEAIASHLTSLERVRDELMFQPFLKWLEENIVLVLREMPSNEENKSEREESESETSDDEEEEEEDEDDVSHSASGDVEGVSQLHALPAKRGTEIRLHGLQLSSTIGTVTIPTAKLVVGCTRCKTQCDITISAERLVTEACLRCHSTFSVTYHPTLLHAGSATIGYMDMLGCSPIDFVLLSSDVNVVCLECGRDNSTKGLSYGQPKFTWCMKCHSKLTLFAEQCKFVQHQPGSFPTAPPGQTPSGRKKKANEGIKEGYPLPETGTCQHYKKSHRWLRFPCCGKVYPCDVCHDSSEDHPMERANRMICGFCSKEQPYTGTKPCVLCASDMTSSKHTSHWEGGQGCRNKVKMSRNDRHKYVSSQSKTASKKTERVGSQGKAKRAEAK